MDKLAKLISDIGKLWETYSGAYFTGIRNTLVLAVVATLIGCVIGPMNFPPFPFMELDGNAGIW